MYSLYPSSIPTILITPTPFRHEIWRDRDPAVTAQYGEVIKAIAKDLDVGVVDSLEEFKGRDLPPLVSDGLHLSAAGYQVSRLGRFTRDEIYTYLLDRLQRVHESGER